MTRITRIGRRAWLTWSATGLAALWSALQIAPGREGWGVALGCCGASDAGLARFGAAIAYAQEDLKSYRVDMGFVAAYVQVRGNEVAIVDTGTPNNGPKIAEVVRMAGLGMDAVKHVILTHYHSDHAGSIGEVLAMAPAAAVYAGAADIPRISAGRDISAVKEGDEIFGLRVIETPGHTLGHISVLDPANAALITGDAVFNINNTLASSPAQFTADMAQAIASTRKLAALSFDKALFMHGPVIDSGASQAFAALAATL